MGDIIFIHKKSPLWDEPMARDLILAGEIPLYEFTEEQQLGAELEYYKEELYTLIDVIGFPHFTTYYEAMRGVDKHSNLSILRVVNALTATSNKELRLEKDYWVPQWMDYVARKDFEEFGKRYYSIHSERGVRELLKFRTLYAVNSQQLVSNSQELVDKLSEKQYSNNYYDVDIVKLYLYGILQVCEHGEEPKTDLPLHDVTNYLVEKISEEIGEEERK